MLARERFQSANLEFVGELIFDGVTESDPAVAVKIASSQTIVESFANRGMGFPDGDLTRAKRNQHLGNVLLGRWGQLEANKRYTDEHVHRHGKQRLRRLPLEGEVAEIVSDKENNGLLVLAAGESVEQLIQQFSLLR